MDMQTSPFGYTLGWNMGVSNFIFGGIKGYSGGNDRRARKNPPRIVVSTSALYIQDVSLTTVVFAIIIDHEHNLPFKDIVIDQSTADSRHVLVRLHLF